MQTKTDNKQNKKVITWQLLWYNTKKIKLMAKTYPKLIFNSTNQPV